MFAAVALLVLCSCLPACAGPAEALLERLLAEAWAPHPVRVEWTFHGPAPRVLEQPDNWTLASAPSQRPAGRLSLTLNRLAGDSVAQTIAVEGTARIFGPALTVTRPFRANDLLNTADVISVEADWSRLPAPPLCAADMIFPVRTARAIVPGRPLTARDIKREPLVRRNQTVPLCASDGAVRIRLEARALRDGAAGDRIPVVTRISGDLRRFHGRVEPDGSLTLIP